MCRIENGVLDLLWPVSFPESLTLKLARGYVQSHAKDMLSYSRWTMAALRSVRTTIPVWVAAVRSTGVKHL